MAFGILGLSVALTWFLLISTAVSALATAATAWTTRRPAAAPARPLFWLVLRAAPSVAALVFVALAIAPSFLRFEPREGHETAGLPLLTAAAVAVWLLACATGRLASGARRLALLEQAWLARATAFDGPTNGIPAFVVDSDATGVALVGILHPRLYVSRRLIECLSPEEFAVVMGHESAHQSRLDNLVRWFLLGSPDAFGANRYGRRAASHWAAAAETVADDRAVAGSRRRALALASALVKVARLRPADSGRAALPMSALYEGGPLTARITRLLDGTQPPAAHPDALSATARIALAGASLLATIGTLAMLKPVHDVTELLVRLTR